MNAPKKHRAGARNSGFPFESLISHAGRELLSRECFLAARSTRGLASDDLRKCSEYLRLYPAVEILPETQRGKRLHSSCGPRRISSMSRTFLRPLGDSASNRFTISRTASFSETGAAVPGARLSWARRLWEARYLSLNRAWQTLHRTTRHLPGDLTIAKYRGPPRASSTALDCCLQ